MSRIGKLPIKIESGVEIKITGSNISIKGPKGELKREIHPNVLVENKDSELIITRIDETTLSKSLHGLTRTLLANMVEGVTKGYERKLEIVGVGYKANAKGNKITFNIGYSHPVEHVGPQGIDFSIDPDNKNLIIIKGIDKEVVGQQAAKIKSYRKPEPYKGKGIRYLGEHINRKAGKTALK